MKVSSVGLIKGEVEHAYTVRTNYTYSTGCTLCGEGKGKIDSLVQISSEYSGVTSGKRVQISSGHRRARSLARFSVRFQWCMTRCYWPYTPTETTLFSSLDSASATSASSFRHTTLEDLAPRSHSRRPALGYLFPFISTIGSRTYILRPRRALLRRADLAVYFITARNDFASPPCKLLGSVVYGDWIHAIVIEK